MTVNANDPELIAACEFIGPERARELKAELLRLHTLSEQEQRVLEQRVQDLLGELREQRERREAEEQAKRKSLTRGALLVLVSVVGLIVLAAI